MMKNHFLLLRCFLICLALTLLLPQGARASETGLIGGADSGLINILLVGQDSLADGPARSDSMILCTICPETSAMLMTSFLRDLYVPIPGYDSNRLNAANAYGGTPLLALTLRENFDLMIDGYLEVDFSSFPQIIDLLGGVELELRQDEADTVNRSVPGNLTAGLQQLNGQQALAYSRIRTLDKDGDFSRTLRQRKLVSSLLDSYRSANLLTVLSLVAEVIPMISTDLSKKELLCLAVKLFPLLDGVSVSSLRIPADGTYRGQRISGMDVLSADLEENKKIISDAVLSLNTALP